jgi:Tfp pilus assembly protein PilF
MPLREAGMKALLMPLVAGVLAGCASAPTVDVPRQLFADSRFRPPAERVTADDLFALNDEMRDLASNLLRGDFERNGSYAALLEELKQGLRLDYDAAGTRPAAQTFATRSGNCLSLVILTAALAREVGVPVHYQSVIGWDAWSRNDGIAFLSGHVNLRVGIGPPVGGRGPEGHTIDFVAPQSAARSFVRPVSEAMLVGMYLNNRAAEALVNGDLDTAYWWARKAIESAPGYLAASNTLGVIYLRHDNLREAEQVFRYIVAREPEYINALTNLAKVVERTGRAEEAAALWKQVAEVQPYPPFYFLDQGQAALERGDAEAALDLFERELRRLPYSDEVHFAIAIADFRRGDLRAARKHLSLAQEYSLTPDRRNIYGAKLAQIKAMMN